MRCPYCGGINSDRAKFCASCGRDMTIPVSKPSAQRAPAQQPPYQQPPYQQPRQGQPVQGYPTPAQPQAPSRVPQGRPATSVRPSQLPPVEPPAPEAPAPFPPRTLSQLQALEQGALAYTVAASTTNSNRKKIVRIVYPRCAAWQQVATLYKAWREQQEERFESIIIEGYHTQDANDFTFTNGQLTFDRDVRLGSQIMNRYLIETGNGYASDSVRIILSE